LLKTICVGDIALSSRGGSIAKESKDGVEDVVRVVQLEVVLTIVINFSCECS